MLISPSFTAGGLKDSDEALKWLRKADDNDYPNAALRIGMIYHSGQGVPQDYTEAAKWFRKAATYGKFFVQYKLGLLYEQGQGVIQDSVEAYKWYVLAASIGSSKAVERRDKLASTLTPDQIAEADLRVAEWKAKHPAATKSK